MAAHEKPKVIAEGGLSGGKEMADLPDLVKVKLTGPNSQEGIKIHKQGFYFLKPGGMVFNIVFILPMVLKNKGDHGPKQEGIRPRPNRQISVGNPGRFR